MGVIVVKTWLKTFDPKNKSRLYPAVVLRASNTSKGHTKHKSHTLFITLKLTETYFKAQVRVTKSDDLQHNEYNRNVRFKSAILLCRSKDHSAMRPPPY